MMKNDTLYQGHKEQFRLNWEPRQMKLMSATSRCEILDDVNKAYYLTSFLKDW